MTWFRFSSILTGGKNFTAKKTFQMSCTFIPIKCLHTRLSLAKRGWRLLLKLIKKKIMIVLKSLHTFDKSICFDVCVCVSVHWCVLCSHVSASNNASLTLWLGISHCLCVHLDSMASERADWPCDLSVWGFVLGCPGLLSMG